MLKTPTILWVGFITDPYNCSLYKAVSIEDKGYRSS